MSTQHLEIDKRVEPLLAMLMEKLDPIKVNRAADDLYALGGSAVAQANAYFLRRLEPGAWETAELEERQGEALKRSGSRKAHGQLYNEYQCEEAVLALKAINDISPRMIETFKFILRNYPSTHGFLCDTVVAAFSATSITDEVAENCVSDVLLANPCELARASAAYVLGERMIRTTRAIDALVAALDDPAFNVRRESLYALERIGSLPDEAIPRIIEILEVDEECVCKSAVAVLGRLAKYSALVLEVLEDVPTRFKDLNGDVVRAYIAISSRVPQRSAETKSLPDFASAVTPSGISPLVYERLLSLLRAPKQVSFKIHKSLSILCLFVKLGSVEQAGIQGKAGAWKGANNHIKNLEHTFGVVLSEPHTKLGERPYSVPTEQAKSLVKWLNEYPHLLN